MVSCNGQIRVTDLSQIGNGRIVLDRNRFGVQGKLESTFHGNLAVKMPFVNLSVNESITSNIDVNELGDLSLGLGSGNSGSLDLSGLFEQIGFNGDIASYNTVNFHVFSHIAVPLSWFEALLPAG